MFSTNEIKNRNVGSTQPIANQNASTTGSSLPVTGDPKYNKTYRYLLLSIFFKFKRFEELEKLFLSSNRSIVEKVAKLNEIYKSDNAFLKLFQNETTILRDK
jgi:hypothetical protein